MAYVVVFPDQEAFQKGLTAISGSEFSLKVIEPPRFCESLVAPTIRITGVGAARTLADILMGMGIPISGIVRYVPFKKDIRDSAPPDPRWNQTMGRICLDSVRASVSDVVRLRVEVTWEQDLGHFIPYMARLIRGGSYRPNAATLAFEEEHRLLAVSSQRLVISRADDLLDAWIMLRSFVDLLCATSDRKSVIKPETKPRRGIGAVEIFRRLPGTNCGRCGYPNCMELAMRLFMGAGRIEECALLSESAWTGHREAVTWLLEFIGPSPPHGNAGAIKHRTE